MKCPKCKKEMDEYTYGNKFRDEEGLYGVCRNLKCWFFGIERHIQK